MKTASEFFEKYASDGAFKKEVHNQVKTLKEGGAENLFAAVVKTADTLGYAVTEDEVKAYRKNQSCEMSDELLNKVSGGFICGVCVCEGGRLC